METKLELEFVGETRSLVAIIVAAGTLLASLMEWDPRYKQATLLADTNHDGCTSKEEWKEAYRQIGEHFDEGSGNARVMNCAQVNKYLALHKKEVSK